MSEKQFETVSSFVDSYQQGDELIDEIINDKHLSATWQRYHLIGDVMRGETSSTLNFDVSSQISLALADEPCHSGESSFVDNKAKSNVVSLFKAKVVQLARPFGQMAIAASAAGLMVLGVQQNVAQNDVTIPANQVVQTIPLGGVAQPVSLNFQQNTRTSQKQAFIEQQRRFQALLADHQQQIKLSSVKATTNVEKDKAEETAK